MFQVLQALNQTPTATILIASGIGFLFIAVVGTIDLGGKLAKFNIDPGKFARLISFLTGFILLGSGLGLEIAINVAEIPDYEELAPEAPRGTYFSLHDEITAEVGADPSMAAMWATGAVLGGGGCDYSHIEGDWTTTWGWLSLEARSAVDILTGTYGDDNGKLYLSAADEVPDCMTFEGVWVEDDSNNPCTVPAEGLGDSRLAWGYIGLRFAGGDPVKFDAIWDYCGDSTLASDELWVGRKQ